MTAPRTNVARRVVRAAGPVDPDYTQEEAIDPATGGLLVTSAGGAGPTAPLAPSLSTLADVSVSGGSTVPLPALAAGPNGIDVDADLGNSSYVRIAADSAVDASRGRRLGPTDTVRFQVANASEVYVRSEDGSAQKVQVSQA